MKGKVYTSNPDKNGDPGHSCISEPFELHVPFPEHPQSGKRNQSEHGQSRNSLLQEDFQPIIVGVILVTEETHSLVVCAVCLYPPGLRLRVVQSKRPGAIAKNQGSGRRVPKGHSPDE